VENWQDKKLRRYLEVW